MSKPIDQEREAFNREYEAICNRPITQREIAWRMWQARASVQPAGGAVPEGWMLVPVKMTEAMYLAFSEGRESSFQCAYEAMLAAAPHPVSGEQKAVGEIVIFGSDLKEVSWSGGKMPAPGTKLYAAPPAAQEPKSKLDALRKRFSDIEDEILAGKHNAQSVFTAMRTAALYIGQPAAQDVSGIPPFAEKIIAKLKRFEECAEDSGSGGVDIGRHWLDLLTQLGLLNRVQRSPALWEMTQQAEYALAAHRAQAQGGDV